MSSQYNLSQIGRFPTNHMIPACSHPKVRIVSRDEDAEYVECEDCREVFESAEFRDMEIENKAQDSGSEDD